jgi:hypothetical protein
MHAVVVKVTIEEAEKAQEELENRVVPNVSRLPGLVAGNWTRSGDDGMSMIVFDSEDHARAVADRLPQMLPDLVTLKDVEVREVVANT